MCGIAGFWTARPTATDAAILQRMTDVMQHRGPDADGQWASADGDVRLGHRRLSIIDLAASRQPMCSADERYALSYNGEIYNFRELREELRALGHEFRTDGDTEVLLCGYQAWGEAVLQKLHGMFAFAIYDSREQELFLARDQLGVKPLYWWQGGEGIVFASELKSLRQHPAVPSEVDPTAISLYLECQYVPGTASVLRGVQRLAPASCLRLRLGVRAEPQTYWQPDWQPRSTGSDEDLIDQVHEGLRRSVRSMLVSDVPLGAFLSGGVDSSVLAALMMEEADGPVRTFNMGFKGEAPGSEHEVAQRVADHLGCEHHSVMIDPDDILGEFERFQEIYDEPFGDQAALPTLLLSRYTRDHVTVVLSGEGADEVFGGYGAYAKRLKEERLCRLLSFPGSPLRPLLACLPGSWRKDRLVRALSLPRAQRHSTIPKQFAESLHAGLFSKAFLAARQQVLRQQAETWYERCDSPDYLDRLLWIDQRLWLPDDLLTKVDRASMASGLEARVPYLDHAFIELCARLPARLKVAGQQTKVALKAIGERYLPKDIIHRSKSGFVMPLPHWLRTGLKDRLIDCLGPDGLGGRGLFRAGVLDGLLQQHVSGRKNRGFRLWTLLVLELWFRRHAPGFSLA